MGVHAGRPCILLVDDHEDTLMLQAILLRRDGYDVVTAADAAAALAAAAEHEVDLVVSDLRLPDRSGVELMRDLRDRHGLRGLALTGAADESAAAERAEAGFVQVLLKPIAPEDLSQAVAAALVGPGPAGE